VENVENEPLFAERVAGIDIGKTEVMVTIRVPSDTRRGRRQQETREFRAVRKDLLALADWLRCWGVTKAGMEATGDYWKPVYFLLEREGFDCVLYHAAQVKALPGRPKTDLLTEPPDVPAAQEAQPSPPPIIGVSERSRSPGRGSHVASLIATKTGHTVLNHLPSFSSLPIFNVSRGGP
jgi:Transposase